MLAEMLTNELKASFEHPPRPDKGGRTTKDKSMGSCQKDTTPLLTHWSYVFLAVTPRNGHVKFDNCSRRDAWGSHLLCLMPRNGDLGGFSRT